MADTSKIYGIRAVIEAIQAGRSIDKIFMQRGLSGNLHRELQQLLAKEHIKTSLVPAAKLNRLTEGNHQGVVALISPVEFVPLEDLIEAVLKTTESPIFLLLDGITDVRNMGAIIRTAACAGVHGIILPGQGSAPVTGDTVKTSAGGVFQVPLAKVAHLKDAIYHLQSEGVTVLAATEKANQEVYDVSVKGPVALIMGSEERGINPSVLKLADHKLKLPLYGNIDSLNVSVACGIFLYELLRQRR